MIVNAFLQARMNSTRLPGKVLKEILGKPMLLHQIDRLKKSQNIDKVVVLTSTDASDDAIEALCSKYDIHVFRGSLEDVLSRFKTALTAYPCDHVVRITGDCPLLDWEITDYIIKSHIENGNDYTSNTIVPTYADGLDVEVISNASLRYVHKNATLKSEKEHVTYYCHRYPEKFKSENIININGDQSNYRWTVDEKEDFEFVDCIYNEFHPSDSFLTKDILKLLENKKDLLLINNIYKRNEGLEKTKSEDGIV